jgi:hypothetical protein
VSAVVAVQPLDADEQLELQISTEKLKALHGKTFAQRHAAGQRMRELIAQRSPAQIARMELALGLRAPSPRGESKGAREIASHASAMAGNGSSLEVFDAGNSDPVGSVLSGASKD